jgi:hypothetical protein
LDHCRRCPRGCVSSHLANDTSHRGQRFRVIEWAKHQGGRKRSINKLDVCAVQPIGRSSEFTPLVFADLWKGRVVKEDDVIDLTEERRINLEVVTTNLNHLSPYTVPFKNDTFYFDPEEWALLFPREVVSWMKTYAAEVQRPVVCAGRALLPLPRTGMLPIVVAARLSLSFPGLVSAVPLYAVDFSLKRNQDRTAPTLEADRCWFSDGGICSNFPIHFFDSPIPGWPTFAINLKEPHPDFPNDPVWLPSSNARECSPA